MEIRESLALGSIEAAAVIYVVWDTYGTAVLFKCMRMCNVHSLNLRKVT